MPSSERPISALRRGPPRAPITLAALVCALPAWVGCGPDTDRPETAPRTPAIPLPTLRVGEDVALDVRLIPLEPERYVGEEVFCDLAYAGQLTAIEGEGTEPRPAGHAQRATVRCASPTGEGWAALRFAPDAASLAPYVGVGKRVRVVVRGAGEGREGYPDLEFVAVAGDAPSYPASERAFAPVPAGYDFGQVRRARDRVGVRAPCAILHVGPARPIAPALASRYPPGASHHVVLSCRNARGEAWVDLALTPETRLGALRLERGTVLPVRIEARRGGYADFPVVSYVLR